MKNRNLLYFGCMFALLWPSQLLAQVEEIKRQINEIKLDERYVYGEASDEDEATAYYNAVNDLKLTMDMIMGAQKYDTAVFDRIQMFTYNRGPKKRVFVFVPIAQVPTGEAKVPEDEIINTSLKPTDNPLEIVQKPDERSSTITGEESDSDIIRDIMEREMVDDVCRYLESQKKKGTILAFAVAKSLAEIPDNSFLVIYNKSYSVVSFLSPVKAGHRVNLRTNLTDDLRNYSGHGLLWFNLSY